MSAWIRRSQLGAQLEGLPAPGLVVVDGETAITALAQRLRPGVAIQAAIARAGLDPAGYSAHSLRAGFVTYAHRPAAQRTPPAA